MSIRESNLRHFDKACNIDMTASVSEKSINAQMRAYIASQNDSSKNWKTTMFILQTTLKGKSYRFVVDEHSNDNDLPAEFPKKLHERVKNLHEKGSSLYQDLLSMNLFCLENGTQATPEDMEGDKAILKNAASLYKIKYALYIEDGMPDWALEKLIENANVPAFDPDSIVKPFNLQPEKDNVLFRQFFRELQALQINLDVEDDEIVYTLLKAGQQENGILYFENELSLKFSQLSTNDKLPDDIAEKIKNMKNIDPDTVFNISQLKMDLKSLSLIFQPKLQGIDHDIDPLVQSAVKEYFDRIEEAGYLVLGHTVTVKKTQYNYLFKPTVRGFHIGTKTLDYLIGFDDENIEPNMGNLREFPWVSANNPMLCRDITADGAMAISSEFFIPFIAKMAEPLTRRLHVDFIPNVCDGEEHVVYKGFRYKISKKEYSSPQHFTINGSELTYTHSHSQKTQKTYYWVPPIPVMLASTQLYHKYDVKICGKPGSMAIDGVSYPSFNFEIRVMGEMNLYYNESENKGRYFDKIAILEIGIKLNSDGKLDFLTQTDIQDQHPGGINFSGWGEFCTFGMIEGLVKNITSQMDSLLNATLEAAQTDAQNYVKQFNTKAEWFMPGCKTFTYKYDTAANRINAITQSGDFYTFINYVQEQA